MSRRLDIGIASYGNAPKVRITLASLQAQTTGDWRCFVIHNPGAADDEAARAVIAEFASADARFVPVWLPENVGYAGAVNKLFELAETEYIGYSDNDTEFMTHGWDEELCGLLDRFHEIGMAFPNGGAYPMPRGNYTEIMWGVGFCWVINRMCMKDTGPFDDSLGHQEEADYALRVRMAGWKCAAHPQVGVNHNATATNNPASIERINHGVVRWVDKWNRYFNGKNFNYHSPNVTRWEDWPPNALYLEEYWQGKRELKVSDGYVMQELNHSPKVVRIDGREYDLICVPRLKNFYRNRII